MYLWTSHFISKFRKMELSGYSDPYLVEAIFTEEEKARQITYLDRWGEREISIIPSHIVETECGYEIAVIVPRHGTSRGTQQYTLTLDMKYIMFRSNMGTYPSMKVTKANPIDMTLYDTKQTHKVIEPSCKMLDLLSCSWKIHSIRLNKLGTITDIELDDRIKSIISTYGCERYVGTGCRQCAWPTESMFTLSTAAHWWRLSYKLIEATRIKKKMHPNGEFMRRFVERDSDLNPNQ